MKKTLIALAVLAASGASFAQSSVTISGKLRFAFQNNSNKEASVATKSAGVVRTDGDLVFAAVEDLGGGLKASANMAIQTGARSVAAGNRDGNLTLSGNFGTIAIGSIDAGNGIWGLGSAGAPTAGLDSLVIPDSGNIDYMSFTTPSYSGFSFRLMATDSGTATDSANIQTGYTMGSTSATQSAFVYGVTYAAGPLSAAADVTTPKDNAVGTAARTNTRNRISASYDLGIAKVGAGYETRSAAAAGSTTFLTTSDTVLGVSVPMGAFTFGLAYATSSTDGTAYDKKGTDFAVKYDLSKRTYVALQHQNVNNVSLQGVAGSGNSGNFTRVQLAHSF